MENKINKNNVKDIFELTPFQEGLLMHHLKNKNDEYVEQLFLEIEGPIDRSRFENVWKSICENNEGLRSVYRWENLKKPVMIVLKENKPDIRYISLKDYHGNDFEERFAKIKNDDIKDGFDFNSVPFRIKLIEVSDKIFYILISSHHILYDGWSTGLILKEFFKRYDSIIVNEKYKNRELIFKDYVEWVKQIDKVKESEFWRKYLKGFKGKSSIPFVNYTNIKNKRNSEGKRKHTFVLNKEATDKLTSFSKKEKITLATILYSSWGILLSKFNKDDVTIGTTVACRPNHINEIENSIGLYINTIPFVLANNRKKKVSELLKTIQGQLNDREEFVRSSMVSIQEYVDNAPDGMFDTIVVIENYPIDHSLKEDKNSLKLMSYDMDYLTHFLLSVVISIVDDIHVTFTYNEDQISSNAIVKIEEYFCNILDQISSDVDLTMQQINLQSEVEKGIYLKPDIIDVNDNKESICEIIEKQAQVSSVKYALELGIKKLTYQELNGKANSLANILKKKGVKPNDVVLIYCDLSIELIISILAILKLRAVFLPVSLDTPWARINYILNDCGTRFICSQELFKVEIEKNIENINAQIEYVSEESLKTEVDNFSEKGKPDDLAYIIYTSGTTGKPKGVMIENRSLVNYINWAILNYIREDNVSFPLFTSPAFDLTITSIFTPLASGNRIVIYNDKVTDVQIERIYSENKVDVVKLTPSHLKLLKEKIKSDLNNKKLVSDSRIKRFIVGGEDLTTEIAREISELLNDSIEIYNEYGPTEATVGCMLYKYDKVKDKRGSVPIGKHIKNCWIYVLDEHQNIVTPGEVGEMYISGAGLARGYINNGHNTKEKFVENPFVKGLKMYKTGDLARWLDDGNLEFIGRNDQQIKINGYRIELGEIENALLGFGLKKQDVKIDMDNVLSEFKEIERCTSCLLPGNYPDITFNEEGVCNICKGFEQDEKNILSYYKSEKDFESLATEMNKSRKSKYDCLLLYSGGKDSTYVLYRLIDMGLKVLTFTFDNGYISESAFNNIRNVTKKLNVENIVCSSNNMNKVFCDSLLRNKNVCHGCWHALNTYGIKVATDNEISYIVSGLSRGQIYDMRLEGIYESGTYDEPKIEDQLKAFRKHFHSTENRFAKLLNLNVEEHDIEEIQFVDFFRYYNTPVTEIKSYLISRGWEPPKDTGFCSSNCLINDVGIYVHIQEEGYHFYDAPLSWDYRLGQITREDGVKEVTSFTVDQNRVSKILAEIGYSKSSLIKETVVTADVNGEGIQSLVCYYVSDNELNVTELRLFLAQELPFYMIPSYFVKVDEIPLTSNGKVDKNFLPKVSDSRPNLEIEYVMPTTFFEKKISDICCEVLKIKNIGVYDNLFDLGANSFDLNKITSRLNQIFDLQVSVVSLFQLTTINALANNISKLVKNNSIDENNDGISTENKTNSRLKQRRTRMNN